MAFKLPPCFGRGGLWPTLGDVCLCLGSQVPRYTPIYKYIYTRISALQYQFRTSYSGSTCFQTCFCQSLSAAGARSSRPTVMPACTCAGAGAGSAGLAVMPDLSRLARRWHLGQGLRPPLSRMHPLSRMLNIRATAGVAAAAWAAGGTGTPLSHMLSAGSLGVAMQSRLPRTCASCTRGTRTLTHRDQVASSTSWWPSYGSTSSSDQGAAST